MVHSKISVEKKIIKHYL